MLAGEKQLFRALALQWASVVLISGICAFFGAAVLVSGLAGSLAYVLPNTLFALTLMLKSRVQGANPVSFIFGELLKIGGCLAILGLCIAVLPKFISPIVWPALIAGLIVAVQSQFLALVFK
jgi:F0F1-type ATP synthase assembly protein I